MDHDAYTYIAVMLDGDGAGAYIDSPHTLASIHPSLSHVGQVGALDNVQLLSVAKFDWDDHGEEVLAQLKEAPGVVRVDVQELKQRSKRDEL
ncbi:hypothetical protein BDZ89DRAFT_1075982 [Hymenopellis radicata]|nr:hypothetical protein BDZ89DRAFT_1075982 [Hymenopellis radicata]